jgi:hypothetical protein
VGRILAMPGADAPTAARLWALDADGGLRYWGGDLPGANDRYEEQLALARALGDRKGIGEAQFNLAHTGFLTRNDVPGGEAMLAEAKRIFTEIGDEVAAARVNWTMTNLLLRKVEPERARADMLAGRKRFLELGDDWYVALADGTLSWTELVLGNVEGAVEYGMRSLRMSHEMGDVASATISLRGAMIYAILTGRMEEAATIDGAFEALCRRYGVRPPAFFEEIAPPGGDATKFRVDPEAYPEAMARGARMSLDEAVDYVIRTFEETIERETPPSPPG